MTFNPNMIGIVINGVGVKITAQEMPTMSKSGEYYEAKTGMDGSGHDLEINGVYDILALSLRWNDPVVQQLESLAENHTRFAASYKDRSTGKTYNSTKARVRVVGDSQGDNDRQFTIDFRK